MASTENALSCREWIHLRPVLLEELSDEFKFLPPARFIIQMSLLYDEVR